MKNYDFDTLINRRGAGAAKWEMMYREKPEVDAGIVPLSVADMEFPAAPEIRAALKAYIDGQIPGDASAPSGYLESVCAFFQRRHGVKAAPEELIQTPGIVYALPRAIRALSAPGEGVIIMTPVYYPFYRAIRNTERVVASCPLRYEAGRYEIDFQLLEELALRPENTVLLLCSPHNPVGRVWTAAEIHRIAEICLRGNLSVIADEIHWDLTFPGHPHVSFGTLEGELAERTILCTAPSKTFNLAGLNQSNLLVRNEGLRRRLLGLLRADATPMQSPLGYVACQTAYEQCDGWLEALLAYLDENRRYVASYIGEQIPALYAVPLEGTYLQWVDCRGLGLEPEALKARMQAHDLFFDEGSLFGAEGDGFERINLACPRTVLAGAMERLKAAAED
mgnify:CR=1 FL=1